MSRAGVSDRLEVNIKHKSYRAASGGHLHVLGEVSLALRNGEVAALVGPSGCGKTTLLRIVVGLDHDFEGRVCLPARGRLGVVFQEPRLLPWRTVEENVRFVAPHLGETDSASCSPRSTFRASSSLSRRTFARSSPPRRSCPRVCRQTGSAGTRRTVRLTRRRACSKDACRTDRIGFAPARDDASCHAQRRGGDRIGGPDYPPFGFACARARRHSDPMSTHCPFAGRDLAIRDEIAQKSDFADGYG